MLRLFRRFLQGNEEPIVIPVHVVSEESKQRHLARLKRVRQERDQGAAAETLRRLEAAARDGRENLMPFLMEAAGAYATLGEMCNVLRAVYGEYREPALV